MALPNAIVHVGTFNAHALKVRRNPDQVERIIRNAFDQGLVDVLALQEMGHGERIMRNLARSGFGIYPGDGSPGAIATPVMYRPGLDVRGTYTYPLLPRTFVGLPGAGISPYSKRKVANGVAIKVAGRRITVYSGHAPASTYLPIRSKLSERFFVELASVCRSTPGIVVAALDTNQRPGSRRVQPMLTGRRPMRSAQLDAGGIPTWRGKRPIDDVFVLDSPKRVRGVTLSTYSVPRGFDHAMAIAALEINPRP